MTADNKSVSDILRAKELAWGLDLAIGYFMSASGEHKAFAYEVPTGSQSSRAAVCLGMAKGVIASALVNMENCEYPLNHDDLILPIMPSAVHRRATGKLKATKDEIMYHVVGRFSRQISVSYIKKRKLYNIAFKNDKSNLYNKTQFEHIADSLVIGDIAMDKLVEHRRAQ